LLFPLIRKGFGAVFRCTYRQKLKLELLNSLRSQAGRRVAETKRDRWNFSRLGVFRSSGLR
jgi:hypothetical protein